MRNFILAVLKSTLFVFILTFLFSSCITDRSLSQNDFYKSRVVNKKADRNNSLLSHHKLSGPRIFKRSIHTESKESLVTEQQTASSTSPNAIGETAPAPAVDIASLDNKLFTDPVPDRLSKRINNLYTSDNDLRSFRKGYKEIKKEQAAKFIKSSSSDDPLGNAAPPDRRPGMSIASFVLSIVGLFVAGLICGTLAVIFGIIGMKRGLRGLAIAGFIIGVIDIVAALIIISSM